ncbi:MAG: hypothetical protein P1S60_00765 [Anaerolineae bacterium]|nr:hypothetical protein [Anaerolineae bacterium]
MRFAGSALIPSIMPALEHLEVKVKLNPDLTICLWDTATTQTSPLNHTQTDAWELESRRGELLKYTDDRYIAAIQVDSHILSVLDLEQNIGLCWTENPFLPVTRRAAPCQFILHWWLREKGLLMIHSAAVGTPDGAALLVGRSGAGKSTAALACLHAGMQYLSDDRCVLGLEPSPRVYALYNSGKVDERQINLFPRFHSAWAKPAVSSSEKALLFVKQTAPEQIAQHLPIKVAILLHLGHCKETTFKVSKPMVVCQALTTSTMIYAPGWSQVDLHGAAQFVQRVPCFKINAGTEIQKIPGVVAHIIKTAAS